MENPKVIDAVYLVTEMPEDLTESRTSYEELKEMLIECVYHIENNLNQ